MMWKTTNGFGEEKIYYTQDEYNVLKKELEEINNLANEECEAECGFHWCKGTTEVTTCVIYKIKNKINEVLKNET